jgi:ubiquinone/menaquinone biosynthesis C-methylase UbiE
VAFTQADAQVHPLRDESFDVALSRFGTMFFADPVAAFANIGRALRHGGRLCIVTWQPPSANEWLTVPVAVLLDYGSMPEPIEGLDMFSQADPAKLTSVLTAAGFEAVEVVPVTVPLMLGDDSMAAAEYLAETAPGRALLETIPEDVRPTALAAVRTVLADFVTPQGVQLNAGILVTTAHVPSWR